MLLYNNGSRTGKLVAGVLGLPYNRNTREAYNCINWGSGVDRKVRRLPRHWLNNRESVDIAKNKLNTFRHLEGKVIIPEYTTDRNKAREWSNTTAVYCRTLLRANQGRGIVVAKCPSEVVYAPLYTKRVIFDHEYRVHIFKGEVIGISKKIPKEGTEQNEYVRNYHKGWKFSLRDVDRVHSGIKEQAIKALDSINLDFGAVDLGWNKTNHTATIFEINTAPGMDDGTILYEYIEKFRGWIDEN